MTALLSIILGGVYLSYGVIAGYELRRDRATMPRLSRHFGWAFIGMALTCGPHHLAHGIHLALGNTGPVTELASIIHPDGAAVIGNPAPLDFLTLLVGLPFGATWVVLKTSGVFGGRADYRFRAASGTVVGVVVGSYMLLVATVATWILKDAQHATWNPGRGAIPNLALIGLYATIAVLMFRTLLRTHPLTRTWSASGIALAGVFATCALMHAVYAYYVLTGRNGYGPHAFIDWAGVPAAAYFLWVVRALHHQEGVAA